jgi:hypothetical protein
MDVEPPPGEPPPRGRADVSTRKLRNRESEFSSVKVCFAPTTAGKKGPISILDADKRDASRRPKVPFCVYKEVVDQVEGAVKALSKLRVYANRLADIWERRCVEAGVRPSIRQNDFFDKALRCCLDGCGIRTYRKKATTDPALKCLVDAYDNHFLPLFEDVTGGFESLKMPPGTSGMVSEEARMMAINHATFIQRTIVPHIMRYVALKLSAALPPALTTGKPRGSLVALVRKALVGSLATGDDAEELLPAEGHQRSIAALLQGFPRIRDAAAAHVGTIQGVVDDVWGRLEACGPMPLSPSRASKHAGDYSAFRLWLLAQMEAEADRVRQQMADDAAAPTAPPAPPAAKDDGVETCELEPAELDALLPTKRPRARRKLTFSMQPVLKYRAAYVRITPSILRCMLGVYKKASKEADTILRLTADDDEALFSWVFNVHRARAGLCNARGWRVFGVLTDGVGCSVVRGRPMSEEALRARSQQQSLRLKLSLARTREEKAADPEARAAAAAKREQVEREVRQVIRQRAAEAAAAKEAAFAAVRCRFAAGEFRRVLGVDDGKKACVTVAECGSRVPLERPGAVKHAITSVSGKEYRSEMGFVRRAFLTHKWTQESPAVKAFNEAALSPCTADLERYKASSKLLFEAMPAREEFFVTRRRFRRLRFWTYARGQAGLQRMADKVLQPARGPGTNAMGGAFERKQPGQEKDVLVGWENASFNGVRGCAPCGPGRLKKVICARATVVDVDAFRNSKCCSCCRGVMEGLSLNDLRGAFENLVPTAADGGKFILNTISDKTPLVSRRGQRVRSYSVRLCTSEGCPRMLFNRDTNAAINVRAKLLMRINGQPMPAVWTRTAAAA